VFSEETIALVIKLKGQGISEFVLFQKEKALIHKTVDEKTIACF